MFTNFSSSTSRRATACLALIVALLGSPSLAGGAEASAPFVATGVPTEITHSGAIFNGTMRYAGCCNVAVFAVSASPTFDGPVYDYAAPYSPGQTLIIRMQYGNIGETFDGQVMFDGRNWTPDGTTLLNPSTTYYVRLGLQVGADDPDCLWSMSCYTWAEPVSFTTRAAQAPLATTGDASATNDSGATVTGTVTALDAATTSQVEYSTSVDFTASSVSTSVVVPAGESPVPVSWRLSGLAPSTTYFYRVVATNAHGTARGETRSFGTSAAVGISINDGASITTSRAVKVAVVAPAGATSVIISTDGGFSSAQTFAVDSAITWTFDDLGAVVLTRSLYARFSGPGVDSSRVYSDDIIHDARAAGVETGVVATGTRRMSATSVARLARLSTQRSAQLRLTVAPSSAGRCRVQGLSVHAVRSGLCRVTVSVTSRRGQVVSRTLTIRLG